MQYMEAICKHDCGAAGGASGDVAPRVIAAGADLPGLVGAGGAGAVETDQFVRPAGAVEILLLRAGAVQWPLPELTLLCSPPLMTASTDRLMVWNSSSLSGPS